MDAIERLKLPLATLKPQPRSPTELGLLVDEARLFSSAKISPEFHLEPIRHGRVPFETYSRLASLDFSIESQLIRKRSMLPT